MKRRVHWADETPLEQVKKALAKDKDDMSEVAKILRSISHEEAHDIIHHDDGYVVARIIKLAYYNMKNNKYNKASFQDLYSALLDIDQKYTVNKTFQVTGDIIDRSSREQLIELYAIGRHIGEVKLERAASEVKDSASAEKDSSTPDDAVASVSDKLLEHDGEHADDDNTKLSNVSESSIFIDLVTSEDINSEKNYEEKNISGYIADFFFGWINYLPSYIRENIKHGEVFQEFQEHYSEMQRIFDVTEQVDLFDAKEELSYNSFLLYGDCYDYNEAEIAVFNDFTPSIAP